MAIVFRSLSVVWSIFPKSRTIASFTRPEMLAVCSRNGLLSRVD